MISWRIVNDSSSSVSVEIFQRHAWRYTYFTPYCTDATIPNGQPLLGSGSYSCVSTCPSGLSTFGNVQVPCTGYNIGEQYAMGEGRFQILVPHNSSFIAVFTNSAWFNLVTGTNLVWSVAVQIQTFKRIDNGQYNHAPIITMLPIYRLRNKISYSLKINVADNDFDPYICLWSTGSKQCGGLSNSVPGGIIDNYGCYLNFTPQIIGYYAAAITAEDFIVLPSNISSTAYLSQVPIQFVFDVYNSTDPCVTGPIYIGDLVPDICIYMGVGDTYITRVRFQVQCTNATVASIISVNLIGLTTTALQQDPSDSTIFVFLANFTSSANQIGQNLYCFSGVDSIGNQGDSACLRFTVFSQISSLQPLYTSNATHYPTGTVSKTTSVWTILTESITYQRPTTETYIRFKQASDNTDYYILNVVTATDNVLYLTNSIVINTAVIWTPGEQFYIYFDPGVLDEEGATSSCTKVAMPITDPNFWPFNIPYESTITSTTTTSTTSVSSTTTMRTIPTRQTLETSSSTTSVTVSTTTIVTTTVTLTNPATIAQQSEQLSISSIVLITLASLCVSACLIWSSFSFIRIYLIRSFLLDSALRQQFLSMHSIPISDEQISSTPQHKLTIRHFPQHTL
ncbi:unnamed protein product [Adineta steineri]|uniref:Uncharacterized protein n=1 Tax=Adineta steineri TaxID=433720 RepID=A0A814LLL8_9BILA|nr:unnamed protein product [Adineta steineri]